MWEAWGWWSKHGDRETHGIFRVTEMSSTLPNGRFYLLCLKEWERLMNVGGLTGVLNIKDATGWLSLSD